MRFRVITGSAFVVLIVGVGLLLAAVLHSGADSAPESQNVVLLAAGDIAECDHQGDEATARILAEYPHAAIATLGDNAYQDGTLEEFENC